MPNISASSVTRLNHRPEDVWELLSELSCPERWHPFYDSRRLGSDKRDDSISPSYYYPLPPAHGLADGVVTHELVKCLPADMTLICRTGCRLGTLTVTLAVHQSRSVTLLQVDTAGDAACASPEALANIGETIARNIRLVCKLRHPLLDAPLGNAHQPETVPALVGSRYPEMNVHGIGRMRLGQLTTTAFAELMAAHRPIIVTDYGASMAHFSRLSDLSWWAQKFGSQSLMFQVFGKYAYEDVESGFTNLKTFFSALNENPNRLRAAVYEFPARSIIGLNRYLPIPKLIPDPELVDGINLWVGAGHLKSPMHQDGRCIDRTGKDPNKAHNLNLQICGRKHWVIAHPNQTAHLYPHALSYRPEHFPRTEVDWFGELEEDRHPTVKQAEVHECVMEPGELLYIPRGWWHQVYSLGTSINQNVFFRSPDY